MGSRGETMRLGQYAEPVTLADVRPDLNAEAAEAAQREGLTRDDQGQLGSPLRDAMEPYGGVLDLEG